MSSMQKVCKNGHYYDSSLSACPFCKSSDDVFEKTDTYGATGAFDGGPTDKVTDDDWNPGRRVRDASDDQVTEYYGHEKRKGPRPIVGWLVCTKGPDVGKDFRLYPEHNKVGRQSDQDVRITDPKVSRTHFTVTYDPRANLYYASMASGRAIVYLNNYPLGVSMVTLKKGDILKVADTTLVFIPFEQKDAKWEWN